MSIKGYPSSQKSPLGTGITANFATVIPTDPYRNALEVPRFAFRVNDDVTPRTATSATGIAYLSGDDVVLWIGDTATPAMVGDFVRFENGPARYLELPIVKVETNRFMVSCVPTTLPVVSNTFFILRSATQRTDSSGSQIATVSFPTLASVEKAIVSSTISNAAYTQIIASTSVAFKQIEFLSTMQTPFVIAFGAAASEVDKFYVGQDGLRRQEIAIPAGTRISVKALQAPTEGGLLLLNAFA